MENFDKVSLEEISRKDLLLILKSLEFTYKKTGDDEYINLRKSIVSELSILADSDERELIKRLES
ncbi:hypothetical protein WG909_15010 [Peptostreptococcaceae bacterium AGR-M142]